MKKFVMIMLLVLSVYGAHIQQDVFRDTRGLALDGRYEAKISIYSDDTSEELLWAAKSGITISDIGFEDGYITDLSFIPAGILSLPAFWVEIVSPGIATERIAYFSTDRPALRREGDTDEVGETTEEMATHLQIGRVGETDDLVVHSPQVGFGVATPSERIDVGGAIAIREGSSPTSTTDVGKVYVNDADGHLYFIDEAGNITDLTVDANAVQSVSSSANHTGRMEHMRFIPGSGTDITESATDDTIFIQYSVDVTSGGVTPCSSAPSSPSRIDGSATVCTGEPGAAYAVPPVSGASYYIWSIPADAVITDGLGTNSVNVVFGSTDGNVCAQAHNDCGTSASVCIAVTLNRPTSPGSITGTSPVCPGQTGVSYYIASVPGATNYIWTLPPGAVLASGTGTPNITVNFGTSGGDICVQTENSCGVSTPVCMPVVMTATPATPGVISGSAIVCEGATGVSYSISSVAEATSYTWTVPSGATITAGDGTEAITVSFGTTSGDVCVTASSICGTSSPRCLAVTVNLAPVITVNPSDTEVEEGDPATFNVTATGSGLTYQWQQSIDAGGSWSNVGTSSNSYSTGSTTSGMDSYQYRCIVSGSCSPSDTSTAATLTVSTGLYEFTSHTFTNCGITGRFGPTISQCRSSYTTSWDENPAFFNMSSQGIQEWTVPETGTYRIEVWGAEGGSGLGGAGGRGARMRGDFSFTTGDVIKILVGQEGQDWSGSCEGGGGGGGSYVTTSSNSPLIIAGGGGGASIYSSDLSRMNGTTSTSGQNGTSNGGSSGMGYGGTGGNGSLTANGSGSGSGGGGLLTDGMTGTDGPEGGDAFINGGAGGVQNRGGAGGFGGGGSGRHTGAGAGGYSGGGCGGYTSSCSSCGGGGGGGSYNSGTNQSNSSGVNTGHGEVTITKL